MQEKSQCFISVEIKCAPTVVQITSKFHILTCGDPSDIAGSTVKVTPGSILPGYPFLQLKMSETTMINLCTID